MERKKKKEGSGFYIAICCCVVIIAAVGYANRVSLEEEPVPEQVAQATQIPEPDKKLEKIQEKESEVVVTPKPVQKSEAVAKNVQTEEKIIFSAPVKGKVIEEFSGDDLVYNEALKDWRSHSGVDFAAEIGEQVVCSASGIVERVFDSELGHCVVIDHKNGYRTMYANLKEDFEIAEGDEVAAGDVVGMVGDTALGDRTDLPHLHFEIMKKDESLNPVDYLE